jgi:hypothetical protein
MKKITITFCFFVLLASSYVQAQEIFTDTISNKEYLFLGSVSLCGQKAKVLDENSEISWKPFSEIEQSGLLDSKEFVGKISQHNLRFDFVGCEPFFRAEIHKDLFTFWDTETDETTGYSVKILTKDHTMDGQVLFMFSNERGTVFGVVYRKWFTNSDTQQFCEFNIPEEENTLYSTFFSVDNKVYNGCVTIE